MIARKDGLRGFYIGGLMTACRDGISSGIFFWGCEFTRLPSPFFFVFRGVGKGWGTDLNLTSRFRFPATTAWRGAVSPFFCPPFSIFVLAHSPINKFVLLHFLGQAQHPRSPTHPPLRRPSRFPLRRRSLPVRAPSLLRPSLPSFLHLPNLSPISTVST